MTDAGSVLRATRKAAGSHAGRTQPPAAYWSRMVEAARRMTPDEREEYQSETEIWDRAVDADSARTEK